LAEVLRLSGEPNLAIGVLDEAEMFQPHDLQRARIERQRGLVALLFGDATAATHHMQLGIGRAIRGGDGELLCQAYLDLARALQEQSDDERATAELEQAIDVITLGQGLGAPGCPGGLWRVGLALAERYLAASRLDEARATCTAALAHARRMGFPHARGRVSALLAQICEAQGDAPAALGHRANAIEEMRQLGDRRSTAELLIESARSSRTADAPDAVRLAEQLASEIGWQEGVTASRSLKLP
jgi:tetratricopeptide (TPR) repeat protein